MKKLALTLGLAFFAIGLFAQNATTTATKPSTAGNAVVTKQTPAKPAPAAAKPAGFASTAKPSVSTTAQKPAANPASASFKAKPGTEGKSVTPPVKKHRRHKKAKSATPSTTTAPKATKKQ